MTPQRLSRRVPTRVTTRNRIRELKASKIITSADAP
jgi:hypothetical protein